MRAFNSELVTMPFPDLNRRIAEEQKIVSRAVAAWSLTIAAQTGRLSGPWIELVFRKVEEPAWKERRRRKDPGAEAGWRSNIDLRFLRRAA
jgi:hypothetical protein